MSRQRKNIRLPAYDYRSNGAYAVTICVANRRHAFGRVENGVVRLHSYGIIARDELLATGEKRENVTLDEFTIMPNHVHLILWIWHEAPPSPFVERQFGSPEVGSLSTIIGAYKSAVTRAVGRVRGNTTEVWQERFRDHVIRDGRDLENQRRYIVNNPANWHDDDLNDSPKS